MDQRITALRWDAAYPAGTPPVTGRWVGLRCQVCARLRFGSQGHYRSAFSRIFGTRPRYPWDPQAVSAPWLVQDEFPGPRQPTAADRAQAQAAHEAPAKTAPTVPPLEFKDNATGRAFRCRPGRRPVARSQRGTGRRGPTQAHARSYRARSRGTRRQWDRRSPRSVLTKSDAPERADTSCASASMGLPGSSGSQVADDGPEP
jgi:hypothetical protein